MDKNHLIKELEQIEKVFKNKLKIDFYEAKSYISQKLKNNIEDSLIEKFLKDKGYKNIVKKKDTLVDANAYNFIEDETEELHLINEETEFVEDFDIDEISDMELTPNINRSTVIDVGSTWLRRNERNKPSNYNENTVLIKEYNRTGSDEVFSAIVELNLKLVIKYAMGYSKLLSGNGLTLEDLIQEGTIGLMKGIDRFDTDKGYEFSTYSSWWIKQAIHRAICDKDSIIRLPVHMVDALVKMKKLEIENARMYGEVVPEKITDSLKISMEKYAEYKKYEHQYGSMISLDKAVGDDEDSELINIVGERNVESLFGHNKEYSDPSIIYEETELSKIVGDVLLTLSEKERTIIKYRFGLMDGRARTLEEIGSIYNVTRERIRQIEVKIINRLRHPSRSKKLRPFIGQYEFEKPKNYQKQRLEKRL